MQKQKIALSSTLLLAMFMCGAAALVLPLASELATYRTDENVYGGNYSDEHSYSITRPYTSHSSAAPIGSMENCIIERR